MHVKTTPLIDEDPPQRDAALDRIARSIVEVGAAPAAVCASGFRANGSWHWGLGAAGTLWPTSPSPATVDTIFDLASLTKPFAAVAAATESLTRFDWAAPLHSYLPELQNTAVGSATFEALLSHRAGLLPHRELFQFSRSGHSFEPSQLLRIAANSNDNALQTPLVAGQAVYSDLGYVLAGAAIERRAQKPLDLWLEDVLSDELLQRIGSARQWLEKDPSFRQRCAPTEVIPWRGGVIWGSVHDENAWILSGHGMSGHAGLFGTALGVGYFGASVLDALAGLPSHVAARAAELTTRSRNRGSLAAGFDRRSPAGSTAGNLAGRRAFGHLGFTGTSLWCNPDRSLVAVVLCNRVCPSRDNVRLRAMRSNLNDSLFEWGISKQSD